MAKYNLMDNKDPDFFDQYFDKEEKKPEKKDEVKSEEQPETEETGVDDTAEDDFSVESEDSALKIEQFEQEEADSKISEEIFDNVAISTLEEEETPSDYEVSEPHPVEDEVHDVKTPPPAEPVIETQSTGDEPYDLDSEYESQPALNYKPIIYIVSAIAFIVLGYFAITYFFFQEDSGSEAETIIETPEEQQARELREQRVQFLSTISGTKQTRLGQISALIRLRPANITYSSILLYGESLNLEVFARNRDDLATFNLSLKNDPAITSYKIETVDIRPGQNGGLFALYDINIRSASATMANGAELTEYTPEAWAQQTGLQIKAKRNVSTSKENQFSVSRHEYVISGSEQKCHSVIQQMANLKANFQVHKLSLLPTNQTNMNKSSFQMRVVLDFYL